MSGSLPASLLSVLSISFAVAGEWILYALRLPVPGVLLLLCGLLGFAWSVLPAASLAEAPPSASASEPHLAAPATRWTVLVAAACAATLTWLFSDHNRFRPETLVFWILSVGLFLAAGWERTPRRESELTRLLKWRPSPWLRISWSAVGLLAVLLVAAFFRYFQIAVVPPEPTLDHAEKLLDIHDLMNGQFKIFFERNTGREPIQFYVAVPFVQAFGLTHLALKVEQATMGLLTVPIIYLIGKEIADERFGLLASFMFAISNWSVEIARVGLRFPLYPLFVALSLLFLFRALRKGTRNDYLMCGLVTGVGLYGYSPFRAMVLLIPILVAVKLVFERTGGWRSVQDAIRNTLWLAGASLLVFVPLLHYMVEEPEMFWFRALSRMSDAERPLQANWVGVLLQNFINAFGMFNWRGDVVWVNSIPLAPVLDFVSGGLFLLGVSWCVYEAVRYRRIVPAYFLASIPVLMLPSILSLSFPGENPSVVRTSGAGPVVALVVAVPLYLVTQRLSEGQKDGIGRRAAVMLLVGVMALATATNYERYFVAYPAQYREQAVNTSEMAEVVGGFSKSVGSIRNVYVKHYPEWLIDDIRNIGFRLGLVGWDRILETTQDVLTHNALPGNKLYIIHENDVAAVAAFRQRFPQGQLYVYRSATPGKDFFVFFVPGS